MELNKENFEDVIKECFSIADVCRSVGIVPNGGNYKTIKSKIKLWNINTDHFTGQGWNSGDRFKSFSKKIELSDILIENSTYTSHSNLKKRLIAEGIKKNKCEICDLNEWMGKKLSIQLHHINGNNTDNRIENLKMLCPNCHSQTPTFAGNNARKHIKKEKLIKKEKMINICKCGEIIQKRSKACIKCAHINQRKVNRPNYDVLIREIELNGYAKTGKKYGVSGNSIKKWIKIRDYKPL